MRQALRKANHNLLPNLKTVLPHPELVQHFPVGTSLLQVASAAKDPDTTWPIFNAVLQELLGRGPPARPLRPRRPLLRHGHERLPLAGL